MKLRYSLATNITSISSGRVSGESRNTYSVRESESTQESRHVEKNDNVSRDLSSSVINYPSVAKHGHGVVSESIGW
jgi:hypothetical protein